MSIWLALPEKGDRQQSIIEIENICASAYIGIMDLIVSRICMTQSTTALTDHLDAFRIEAMMLLRFQLAFLRIAKFKDFHQMSRTELIDRVISLKTIENDLVIRICKFDDHNQKAYSFNNLSLESHENRDQIERQVSEFKNCIREIKQKRRHEKLAHLKIGEIDNEYEPKFNLLPIIKIIITTIDLLNNSVVSYQWSDGSQEKYELRSTLSHYETQ
jgi:hypothetical protein